MTDVVIDGTRYVPQGDCPSIGIGITTKDRPEAFNKSYPEIVRHSPGARIVVVDDASKTPVPEATYRFEQTAGIARAKNKCLELLDGCEHVFLFDDDAYPLIPDWYRPYVDSPEPHLMRIFKDLSGPRKLHDIEVLYEDSEHIAYTGSRGVMVYAHRSAIAAVGGMDLGYGLWGYEHPDWSNRIHSAGLTTWRYADVVGSDKLIYCMDEHEEVSRTVDPDTRRRLVEQNVQRHHDQYDSPTYYEYREQRDLIITTLFTKYTDPQRGKRMQASSSLLRALRESVKGHHFVVLHDELTDTGPEFNQVETNLQPYFQRWVSIWRYLRDHPEIRFVWAVDGTDVELLRDPFPSMETGKLYLGSEPTVVGSEWMLKNHPASKLQEFMREYADRTLLNAGLVGGDRTTVMTFVHDIIRLYWDNATARFHKNESSDLGVGDMGALNYVAYTRYADRIVYGPRINTVFKAEEKDNQTAWWKHK